MPLDQLPDLSSDYQIANDQHDTYQHDGHIILRGVVAAEEVQAYRPLITGIVDEMARAKDRQGRISDYSAMFTQVTNVWRMSDAVRRFVFAKRFAKIDTSQEYFERIIREQEIEIRSYELRAGDATFAEEVQEFLVAYNAEQFSED